MSPRGSAPFHIRRVDADPADGRIELRYGFEGGADFVERIDLPAGRPAGTAEYSDAARILLLLAGTSYYKSQAPSTLVVDVSTTPAERALVAAVYDHGLREFAHVNGLGIPLIDRIEWAGGERPPTPGRHTVAGIGRPLVPFGGGKDSTVVLAMLPEAQPMTVNATSTHEQVSARLGHSLCRVDRRIDRLDTLTGPRSLNGHIPITAIISAIAVMVAVRDGYTSVVMANEQAASEPTLWAGADAIPINHQWSKGAAFESLFRTALADAGIGVDYFSLLRSMTEREIMSILSTRRDLLPFLLSCNRAFEGRTAGADTEAPQRWCGVCPKCLFTFLMLATELGPGELVPIFGANLLASPERAAGVEALWSPEKPFECVGERADAARAMTDLATDPRWADHEIVRRLAASAAATLASSPARPTGATEDAVPPAFRARVREHTR